MNDLLPPFQTISFKSQFTSWGYRNVSLVSTVIDRGSSLSFARWYSMRFKRYEIFLNYSVSIVRHFCLSAFFSSFYFPMQPLRFEMAAVMCQFRTQVREGYLRDQYTSPARGAVNPALIAYRPHASAFTGTLQQLKSLSRIEAWNNFPRGQLWYIRATWVEPGTPPEFARRSVQKAVSAFFFFFLTPA